MLNKQKTSTNTTFASKNHTGIFSRPPAEIISNAIGGQATIKKGQHMGIFAGCRVGKSAHMGMTVKS